MLGVCDFIIGVAIDVVHEEAKHLLKGDETCGESQPVQFWLRKRGFALREVSVSVSFEHIDVHLYAAKFGVVFGAGVGV